MSATPDDLMKLVAGGGGTAAAPGQDPAKAAAPGNEPPGGGPMATPAPQEGLQQEAMVNISMVMQLLEHSLPAFGSTSDKGKAIVDVLKKLGGTFGEDRAKSEELIPAELQQLLQKIPGAGGGSPAAQAMGGMPAAQPAMPAGA